MRLDFLNEKFWSVASWPSLKVAQTVINYWASFVQADESELTPANYDLSVIDALKKCKRTGWAEQHVKKFHRPTLSFPDIFEREKWDKFVDGLKSSLKVEVYREPSMRFEEATKLAVCMDVVLNGGRSLSW